MLYAVPNSTFIESPSGDTNVVTINDTSGSISTLQTSINNARSANPNSIIVINLQRGTTYTVSSASLTLGSQECLVGSDAIIQAANSSVTVPLIQIASGSSYVSVAGGTLDGGGANINGIYAPSAARVNVDQVIVRNCGSDCILLTGTGNTSFDNEITVTRCDVSGSAAAGINIQNATQTQVIDNYCHNNGAGISISAAYGDFANNTCNNNATGINLASGNDNVIANNTCNNNATGIAAGGSNNMIASDSMGGSTTTGINSTGSGNIFCDNLFASGNANNFTSGGSGNHIIAYKGAISASGQDYFYPPLIDDQHNTNIVNGMGRTDLTITSTNIDAVQSQYNAALSANPNNVIVLHLNGTFTVGANSLTLQSNTCVLLNGTIQINSSTTANAVVANGTSPSHLSISGGTIDGGNFTPHNAVDYSSGSMLQLDAITMQNFGPASPQVSGSDVVHIWGGSSPQIMTRCLVNVGATRGIWFQTAGIKRLVSDCQVTGVNADGVDMDSSTSGSVAKFNYLSNDGRYGVFMEQSAQHDLALGNVCNNDLRDINLENNSTTARAAVQYNTIACNACMGNNGLRNGAGGDGTAVVTSDNFFFNNTVTNASIKSEQFGTNNYYAQTYQNGGTNQWDSGAQFIFNSPDSDGNLQIRDSNSGLGVIVQNAATTSGAAVVTATPANPGNGTGDDEWQLVPTDSGYFRVVNKNSSQVLAVSGASTANGALIVQMPYSADGTYNDEWLVQPTGTGLYNLINRGSSLDLDVPGGSLTPGTQLDQWQSTGGANQQFSLVQDTPGAATPDFSLSATPGSQTVTAGNGTSYTVTVSAINGFGGTVGLSVSGLPTGATGNFNPTSVTGSGSSTLSISTSGNTPGGSYTLTITGTSGSLQHSTTVTLIISDFSVSVTPSSQTVTAGNGTTYTVTVGSINGFSGSVSLSASGLPAGATAAFNPTSVNAPGSSTLTVTTSGSTPAGTSTLTITGTSGSLVHSTTATLIVNTPQPPPAPTGLTPTAGNAQVALSWTVSSGATSYNVKRSTTSGGPYTTIASVTSTGYTDTNVVNGTNYYYVVSAVNSIGESGNSSEVSATPSAPSKPAAPTNLTASSAKRKINLSWTQSVSSGITNNKVYRSTTNGGPYTLVATLAVTTSYSDSGLQSGTTYYYVVTAVNGNGESSNSNQASATAK